MAGGAGKHDRRKFTAPFVKIDNSMMRTPAWVALGGNSVKLLLHLTMLAKGCNGMTSERGELFLSEREAGLAIGIARNTAGAAFRDLIDKGFIAPVRKGHFAIKAGEKELMATVWRLTFQPHGGRGPTNEYRDWRPPENNSRAQKLNGTGAIFERNRPSPALTGAEIEPVARRPLSASAKSGRSEIEPHIDLAIGTVSNEGDGLTCDAVRALVVGCCSHLNAAGKAAFAKQVRWTAAELADFCAGRLIPPVPKLMALRSAAKPERVAA